MSSTIWTQEELLAEARPFSSIVWRAVEDQYICSTMKLTDTLEEQALLEEVIGNTKPRIPTPYEGYDTLLTTPFRYTISSEHSSRFRHAGAIYGTFYASEFAETAIAEMAFYRLLKFYGESPDTPLPVNPSSFTAFSISLKSDYSLDLTTPPFDKNKAEWEHLTDYAICQNLGDAANATGIQILGYTSVRDPKHRKNFVVLTLDAFSCTEPLSRQTWHIQLGKKFIMASCECPKSGITYKISAFDTDPRLQRH